MQRRAFLAASSLLLLLPLAGCDNVARVFNPGAGGGGGGGVPTNLQEVRTGGDVISARPRVDAVFPEGSGWPATVPVVVVFSESMNEDTVAPPTGQTGSPGLIVRDTTSGNTVPASYDFLYGDQVVVIRPLTGLPGTGGLSYEVVATPTLRDIDGITLTNDEKVLATFTPDQDTSIEDGQIVTTLPLDVGTDVPREVPIYAIFDRPVNPMSVTLSNFVVRPKGGAPEPGRFDYPIKTGGVNDPRILSFEPGVTMGTQFVPISLAASQQYEIVVDDTITFPPNGVLDFGNMTPFATFTTLGFSAAGDVSVANPMAGFENKVNRNNLTSLKLAVDLDATARSGDQVLVRIYGSAAATSATTDVDYVEKTVNVPVDGAQTVTADFSGKLGKVSDPLFDDGQLTFAAQTRRNAKHAGFVTVSGSSGPVQDLVQPTVQSVGPPTLGSPADVISDQRKLALFGTASEELGAAMLTLNGGGTAALYASDTNGHFLLQPIDLGMATSAVSYTLTVTDAAGNLAAASFPGMVVPRGVVGGSVGSGMLTVEAYDESTLRTISGATVLIEPGLPAKPAAGRQTASTDAAGRATFSGLTAPSYTITVVAAGYHLRTLLDTTAGSVSLPLEPIANGTATLTGVIGFVPAAGWRAVIGSNLLPDATQFGVVTSAAAPVTIPPTAVRANRLQAISAFAGPIEPTTVPAFSFYTCQPCGANALTPEPPPSPVAPGRTSTVALSTTMVTNVATMSLVPTTHELIASYAVDFSTATGLDTGSLTGTPKVRVVGPLDGFAGQMMFGLGVASGTGGGSYSVNGTYSFSAPAVLAPFTPLLFMSTQAQDMAGNLSRHRRLLDPANQLSFATVGPLGIPTLTVPASSTGSPTITYQDRLDPAPLMAALGVGGLGYVDLVVTDAAGRQWDLLRQDADGATGAKTVQLPDLTGVTGLAKGTWTVRADARIVAALADALDRFAFENLRRYEVAFARAAAASVTVN